MNLMICLNCGIKDEIIQFFLDEIEAEDVFALENTSVNILCKRKAKVDYCWFRHPSGKRILVSDRATPQPTDEYRLH